MPTERTQYKNLNELPEQLRAFLFSAQSDEADTYLQKTYRLDDKSFELFGGKTMAAILGSVSLPRAIADMRATLVPAVIPEEKWHEFLEDYLKLEAWPLRDLFGDELSSVIETEKIQTSAWPVPHVVLKPLTYSGAASEIAGYAGFSLIGQMRERLRDLIVSKQKGVRIDSQIKEQLMRGLDFGGLGLDAPMADKTVAIISQFASTVRLMSEEEYSDWLAAQTKRKSRPEAPLTEDDEEIEAIKATMPAAPVVPSSVLESAVQSIFVSLKGIPNDEYLVKRLQHVISSRLRDVRSELELRQLLQRDSKVGGLGLSKVEAETMAKSIEQGYAQFHDRIMEEEKKRLDEQMEDQKRKVEERRKREAEEHAQWYRDKILARKQQEEGRQKMTEEMRRIMVVGPTNPMNAHPMDVKEKVRETERFGELVPAPVAPASPAVAPGAENTFNLTDRSNKTSNAPAPEAPVAAQPEVKVSKVTADMAAANVQPRPRMDDVRLSSPRLMGPIQELRGLTLSEFRRMAKDPQIAIQKIRQKIDILGQESFERRVEGIKAMQESSLQQSYIKLVTDAFRSGRPVVELAEELRAKGEDVPSSDEISAIISLNSTLHF